MGGGRAWDMRQRDDRLVVVIDNKGRPRGQRAKEREIWQWSEDVYIPQPGESVPASRFQLLEDAGHTRPYVDWPAMKAMYAQHRPGVPFTTKGVRNAQLPWLFKPYEPIPARLQRLKLPSVQRPATIALQPVPKPGSSPGKQWPMDYWKVVVGKLAPHFELITLGPTGAPNPLGVKHVVTPSFSDAIRYLSTITTIIVPDTGLMHAAAAVGVPAVVIWGGFTSPDVLGYKMHENLCPPHPETPCGQWVPCSHCKAVMSMIEPDHVLQAAQRLAENRLFA